MTLLHSSDYCKLWEVQLWDCVTLDCLLKAGLNSVEVPKQSKPWAPRRFLEVSRVYAPVG